MSLEKLFGSLGDDADMVPTENPNVFLVRWSLKGYGFGEFTFMRQENGSMLIDDECSSRDTIKKVLGILVDRATLWSERDAEAGGHDA